MLAFPSLLLALFLIAVVGPSDTIVVVALAILYIPGFMRFSRGLATAAARARRSSRRATSRAAGRSTSCGGTCSRTRSGRCSSGVSLTAAYSLLAAATLSYLGLGAPPPAPSWGSMSQSAYNYLFQDWWYGIMPGACILIVSFAYLLISAGIEYAISAAARRREAAGGHGGGHAGRGRRATGSAAT